MYLIQLLYLLLAIVFYGSRWTFGLEAYLEAEEDKIDLRKELDKLTQELLVENPFYHSYVFNSGVGNREKLVIEWMKREPQFSPGDAVISWQAIRNVDQIHLLGRSPSSVMLVTTFTQLSINRTASFNEHTINFASNVTSTSLFTRWNPATFKPEVIAVIALDTFAADLLFYSIANGKLVYLTQLSLYRKISSVTTVNVDGKNQLIVVDTASPASVDVFDVQFSTNNLTLDFWLVQRFAVPGEARLANVCRVGRKHYLVLPLSQQIAVYRFVSGKYRNHTQLSLPGVSQVVCFNVALQSYLAINGEAAHVLRLTEGGEFVSELMAGNVGEWLVLPVSSYRSDVLLLSRAANLTKAYVWAGVDRGFDSVNIPSCESCLDGHWSGAVSVPFQQQNCLLIPQHQRSSSLIMVGTSLYNNNPIMDKLKATVENIRKYQGEWQEIQSRVTEIEETLRYAVKRNGTNVVTGKWTINRLEVPRLLLSSMVQQQNEAEGEGAAGEAGEGVRLETLEADIQAVLAQGRKVIEAVEGREKEAWGLEGFKGKIHFKGRLVVENLTISELNNVQVDDLLQNTFRRDKPKPIEQVIIEEFEAEEIVFDQIKNYTSNDFKFSDGPVSVSGDLTFEQPLTVRGEVTLKDGGKVNDVDLLEELCSGVEGCSVFSPVDLTEEEVRNGDLDNNIDDYSTTNTNLHHWNKVIAGRNLTVVKVNGVDWKTLTENVVYRDVYQNITGSLVVKGTVSSPAIWSDNIYYTPRSSVRTPDSDESLESSESELTPVIDNGKILDNLSTASEVIVTELVVSGTVSCDESEWGAEAADVVSSDANMVVIRGDKAFNEAVNVTNNAEVKDTIGGVVVADLLTRDTEQVFEGTTTLHGDITLENVTLNGLWDGMNVSDVFKNNSNSSKVMYGREVTADYVNVLETINGIPVSEFVLTDVNNVTRVNTVDVEALYVTKDIVVDGKVCDVDLDDFNERRLSIQNEQNITGNVYINKAKVTNDFQVEKLNDMEISTFIRDSDDLEPIETLHLSELHIAGDIVTKRGVNGFNLTELSSDAVWLEDDNDIEGPLVFKDEVTFISLQNQGFCNKISCDYLLNFDDVVFKTNKSVTFSGAKNFENLLNISGDLTVQEINGHKVEDILTKTTEQEIAGDLIISGDVRISEDLTVLGLLNGQNITEFGHRCSISEDTISCKGNAVFEASVVVNDFNCSGKMNNVTFDTFLESVIKTDEPQPIEGFKTFTGNVMVENIEDVHLINGESWDEFLSESMTVDGRDQVLQPVVFSDVLTVGDLSVDFQLEADTINKINITEWKTDAIYINEPHALKRGVRLGSASSRGAVSVVQYGRLDLAHDVVRLHAPSSLPRLRAATVTVTDDVEVTGRVNGRDLAQLEQITLKMSGDQVVESDVMVQGQIEVEDDLDTHAAVNQHLLSDAVSLASDQTLHGNYLFDCIEAQGNVSTSELISGINFTTWTETGVFKNGSYQVISGVWRVKGAVQLTGPVAGGGRLADQDLQQLTNKITSDILQVHRAMKNNLTEACEEANTQLASARAQPCELQYLDVTQTLLVSSGPPLVTSFKVGEEDFLAVSEKSCTTNIYKWNVNTGAFMNFHRESFGFSLRKFITLSHEQLTYVVTESSEGPSSCEHSGQHLWIFMNDHFKHVSSVNLHEEIFQGEGNSLYVINSAGMFKYTLHFDYLNGKAFFRLEPHRWDITADEPKEWFGAAEYDWLSNVFTPENCSGDVISVAVAPDRRFVAVASTEVAEVPRHADYIKVYRADGRLFDKLPAESVAQLQWLSVPAQTWLVALHNHSVLSLYQLQGPLAGFQLQMSIATDASSVSTVALPLASKVNLQPFIILQSSTAVKVVRAFVQGDPYLGADLTCSFDQVLKRIPRN